jgi:dihydrofolate reductase
MMASFWTTAAAKERMPAVAEGMSRREKLVFSRTLKSVAWSGSRLAMRGPAEEIAALKKTAGEGLAILGSGTIVSQLARAGLIDEYQFAVVPVALGKGRTLFDGVPEKIALTLKDSRAFRNGNVLLRYAPAGG